MSITLLVKMVFNLFAFARFSTLKASIKMVFSLKLINYLLREVVVKVFGNKLIFCKRIDFKPYFLYCIDVFTYRDVINCVFARNQPDSHINNRLLFNLITF